MIGKNWGAEERGDRSLDTAFFEIFSRLPKRHVVFLMTALKLLAICAITYGTAMSGSEILHEALESLSHVWSVSYNVKVIFKQLFACDNDKRVLNWIMRPSPKIRAKLKLQKHFKPRSYIQKNTQIPNPIFKITIYCTQYTKHVKLHVILRFFVVRKVRKGSRHSFFIFFYIYNFHNSYVFVHVKMMWPKT